MLILSVRTVPSPSLMLMNVPAGRVCKDDSGCYANETCCEEKGVCEVSTSPGACGENSGTFKCMNGARKLGHDAKLCHESSAIP